MIQKTPSLVCGILSLIAALGICIAAQLAASPFVLTALGLVAAIFAATALFFAQQHGFAPQEAIAHRLGRQRLGQSLEDSLDTLLQEKKDIAKENDRLSKELSSIEQRTRQSIQESAQASKMAEETRKAEMSETAAKLTLVVDSTAEATHVITDLTDSISTGAATQRERMHETSTAMVEMSAAVTDISRNTHETAANVENTKQQAEEGTKVVTRAQDAILQVEGITSELKGLMHGLGEQAQGIGQVIDVINDIADQTNLLALNAAIEAARAGEAGRGFAVVADEVRKLAEKTMAATKEVGVSIAGIQQAAQANVNRMDDAADLVNSAAELSRESGNAVSTITSLAEENLSMIQAIAAAAEEQAQTMSEINNAVGEVNDVADSIAHGITDAARSAHELSDMNVNLQHLVQDLNSISADTLFNWTHELATGVNELDSQHKQLINLINTLYRGMKNGHGRDVIQKILTELLDYTVYHFGTEEKYFDKFGYADTASHKRIHKQFTDKVKQFAQQYSSGQADVSTDIMNFLRDWLVGHIKGTDKKYAPFMRQNGVR